MMLDNNTDTNVDHVGARIIFILGGARSGKSRFAERLALQSKRSVAFIATATASDDDMRVRIVRHQQSRPAEWTTFEEPLRLADVIERAAAVADVLILDCLTIWVSNWLFSEQHVTDGDLDPSTVTADYYHDALQEVAHLLDVVAQLDKQKTLLIVSNEVGLGIVPAYVSGRIYRDVLGLVNQRVASASAQVYFMIAGLGVDIKRLHQEASIIDCVDGQ